MMMRVFVLLVAFAGAVQASSECAMVGTGTLDLKEKVDSDKKGIIIDDVASFPGDGKVDFIEFYAGSSNPLRPFAEGRNVKFGIYRPNGNGDCHFDVVALAATGKGVVVEGYNKLDVDFDVKAGDRLGFWWGKYGSITFDYLPYDENNPVNTIDNRWYCYGKGTGDSKPQEDAEVILKYAPADGATALGIQFKPSYRNYGVQFHWCSEDDCKWIGTDLGEGPRAKHDTAKRYLMVDQRFPFPSSGIIDSVKLYAGSDSDRSWSGDRGLKVGIFEGTDTECNFDVKELHGLGVISNKGYNERVIPDWIVDGGQFFGFYWSNFGVVAFDWMTYDVENPDENKNYCGENKKPELTGENSNVQLKFSADQLISYRDYAIWFHWCPDCTPYLKLGSDLGFGPRSKHDTSKRFFQVDQRHPFPGDSHVESVELWAGSDSDRSWSEDRGLKLAILKRVVANPPIEDGEPECYFEVVTTIGLGVMSPEGYHRVDLDLYVLGGMYFGFFWSSYGVVAFDWMSKNENDASENRNYCGGKTKPVDGEEMQLDFGKPTDKDSISHRDYAIWISYCQLCDDTILGTPFAGPFDKHDTAKRYFILDQRYPFANDGRISKIELFAGSESNRTWANDRGMRFVLATPTGDCDAGATGSPCDFEIDVVLGLGEFQTEEYHFRDVDLPVKAGQNFGFYWRNYGVVSYIWLDRSDPNNANYVGANDRPVEGEVLSLPFSEPDVSDGHSYRDYAIWVTYCS